MRKKPPALVGINLNNYVYVRLDERGLQILKKHYTFNGDVPANDFLVSTEKPEYHKMQFWQLIDVFGNTACGSYSPYSMGVYIEKKDISEP